MFMWLFAFEIVFILQFYKIRLIYCRDGLLVHQSHQRIRIHIILKSRIQIRIMQKGKIRIRL
jgi:hypothetical protein